MWSYYGSKGKVVDCYPPPKFDKIIEPFAGSAKYALKYWDKDVLLVEKNEIIVRMWKYLQQCSKDDIMGLPILENKEDIRDYNLPKDTELFMRFQIGEGLPHPQWLCSSLCTKEQQKRKLKRIANNLHKIKHWQITHGDYLDIKNEKATWFIDPPYEYGGHAYKFSNKKIDFQYLAEWCKSRKGHVIVCENTKAGWLDFKPMKEMQGSKYTTTEAIWSNYPTAFDNVQLEMKL